MNGFQAVGVSSHTGEGFGEFIAAVESSREEYERFARFKLFYHQIWIILDRVYLPELNLARERREKSLKEIKADSMNRLMKDMAIDRAKNPIAFKDSFQPGEDDDEDDDDGNEGIIDRCKSLTLIYLYEANIPFI